MEQALTQPTVKILFNDSTGFDKMTINLGCLAFEHLLQLAKRSFPHFLRFQLLTIFTHLSEAINDFWALNNDLYR